MSKWPFFSPNKGDYKAVILYYFNTLRTKSDQLEISPYNINAL